MLRLLLTALLIFAAPSIAGTVVEIRMPIGTIGLELYDQDKPITVTNFLNYVTSGRYQNSFAHRLDPGFVLQGGGYYLDGSSVVDVDTFSAIQNEYSSGTTYSNTFGTIAMARVGGQVNSATSQWFINLGDNSFLDTVDEGFTVFGTCIYALDGNGNAYANPGVFLDAINSAFSDADENNYVVSNEQTTLGPAFGEMPLLFPALDANALLYTDIVVVPEPTVCGLFALGGLSIAGIAIRRRRHPRTR